MSSFCKCKSYSHFFSKNISVYAIFNDQSFNDTLTNGIVSFEQLGPECLVITRCIHTSSSVGVKHGVYPVISSFSISTMTEGHWPPGQLPVSHLFQWGSRANVFTKFTYRVLEKQTNKHYCILRVYTFENPICGDQVC